MSEPTEVFYNRSCPVCRFEIDAYARHADQAGLAMAFTDIAGHDLARHGLDEDMAARRLYILHKGQVISGMPAFRVMWAMMPKYRWLARVFGLPGLRQLGEFVYDRIAAPLLYAAHRRRQAKRR